VVGKEQAEHVVGKAASEGLLEELKGITNSFHKLLRLDIIRAYHFGARLLVELEVLLPGEMTVIESHDIALALQKEIEMHEEV